MCTDALELIKTVLLKAGDTPPDALYDLDRLPNSDSSRTGRKRLNGYTSWAKSRTLRGESRCRRGD